MLRRAWDARAWADGRPDKVTAQPGEDLAVRWLAELAALGYRDRDRPVAVAPTPVGGLDRDGAVDVVLTRLAAVRSAWNAADVRGGVEQLIAGAGVVADPGVRIELAEDLTARAVARCVPLLEPDGVPEHIRAWTSRPVLDVEADLTTRLAARAAAGVPDTDPTVPAGDLTLPVQRAVAGARLDAGQAAAAAALAGDRALVVVEGAAGAGKTTTLAAARELLTVSGHRQVMVTPSLKAAKVAAAQVGTAAGSAAWLVFAHGWRWTDDGAWTRLTVGQDDPVTGGLYTGPDNAARLRAGDLLICDEAGMLDQDTARALLTIADECQVRLALMGDRHQLPAVGRGGVLDLAVAQVDADAYLTLDGVHRFTRTDATGRHVPDTCYADLTLAMRAGDNPGKVFDALLARGQIRLRPDEADLQEAVAAAAASSYANGERIAVVVDTHEQAAAINAAIRDRLVADGRVDDTRVAMTRAGQRIGAGDRVATRRNDRDLDVANRDTWTVAAVGRNGGLLLTPDVNPAVTPAVTPTDVTPAARVPGGVTPVGGAPRVLPPDYVNRHVELAYAGTAHGVQGDTVLAAHTVIGEHTGAAAAYVGMTRGRSANTAHLVATDADEAREQWVAVFGRDGADLGPAHAAAEAVREAARYATPRPVDEVLAELHRAWAVEQECLEELSAWEPQRDTLREVVAREATHGGELASLAGAREQTAAAADRARERVESSSAALAADTDRIRDTLLESWDGERDAASAAARVVLAGSGRLGLRRGAVAHAGHQLSAWADRWRPQLPDLPTDTKEIARVADRSANRSALWRTFDDSARRAAVHAHPEHAELRAAADAARQAHEQAREALAEARRQRDERLDPFGPVAWAPDPADRLADLRHDIAATRQQLTDTRARIATLTAEPALLAQPADRLDRERDAWRARRDTDRKARTARDRTAVADRGVRRPRPEDLRYLSPQRTPGPGISR